MSRGVPQSYYVDQFAGEGIMFEGAAGPPDYLAMAVPFTGERHREVMLRYKHLAQFGVMISDRSRGSVRARGGRVAIRYDLCREDRGRLARGVELMGELYRAAGAREIYPPRPDDVMAFHPLGTARADADASGGVVDGDLKVHGVEGLYVADGSVVPSSLGVNPQITIMALATRLAYHLLGKPAPDEEPQPESIAEPRIQRTHALAG